MTGRGREVPAPGAVGQRVPRVDAADKVTGRAVYVSDVAVAGMLEALYTTSTLA
jgi:CO/xanthine dehydrogenase Mo-binding subunit